MNNHSIPTLQLTEREREILQLVGDGLSNKAIASQLYFTEETVKWYLKQIYSKLGVHSRTEALARANTLQLLASEPPLIVPTAPPKHNLPTLFPQFIGRKTGLEKLTLLLRRVDVRLMTIVGPGGVGKTRVGIELASRHVDSYADGVCWVSLAPLQSAGEIVPKLLDTLELRLDSRGDAKQQLLHYLGRKQLLLVLDNFEHLLEGADIVLEILASAPQVKIIVTSREKLNLIGEHVFPLRTMRFPSDTASVEEIYQYASVQLFIQRARQISPDFEVNEPKLRDVVRICRLAGMPLAILLAAGWVDTLSVREIIREMQTSLDFLETELRDLPQRQRSMRAVFASSWQLLTQEEKHAFSRFAVFRGGFTRAAAQQVTGASLRTLAGLVNKSLLQHNLDTKRYEIHELVRQYAAERLADFDATESAQNAHMEFYLHFLEEREVDLRGRRQLEALDEIEADFENVKAAWSWAIAHHDINLLDRGLESLFQFCNMRSIPHIGAELIGDARSQLTHVSEMRALFERLNLRWAYYRAPIDDVNLLKPVVENSLIFARQNDNRLELILGLLVLGSIFATLEDFPATRSTYDEIFTHCLDINDQLHVWRLFGCQMTWYDLIINLSDVAPQNWRQILVTQREAGDKLGMKFSLETLGYAEVTAGQYVKAEEYYLEAYSISNDMHDKRGVARHLSMLARIGLTLRGEFAYAQQMAEQALEIEMDNPYPYGRSEVLKLLGVLAALDDDYKRAKQFVDEVFQLVPQSRALTVLSLVSVGFGNFSDAREQNRFTLADAFTYHRVGFMFVALPVTAIILAHEGQLERAVELLALCFNHPASGTGWLNKWALITRLRTDLEAELGTECYAAAWERGKTLDVETVVRKLLARISLDVPDFY